MAVVGHEEQGSDSECVLHIVLPVITMACLQLLKPEKEIKIRCAAKTVTTELIWQFVAVKLGVLELNMHISDACMVEFAYLHVVVEAITLALGLGVGFWTELDAQQLVPSL